MMLLTAQLACCNSELHVVKIDHDSFLPLHSYPRLSSCESHDVRAGFLARSMMTPTSVHTAASNSQARNSLPLSGVRENAIMMNFSKKKPSESHKPADPTKALEKQAFLFLSTFISDTHICANT